MAKDKSKPAPQPAGDAPAPKKRSKLKLAIFALVPLLLLGGGGYAGWTFFLAAPPETHAAEGEHGTDAVETAAIDPAVAAESSFTYSYALSHLLRKTCGRFDAKALKAASEAEAHEDGAMINLAWVAALRRTGTITAESCGKMRSEVEAADAEAAAASDAKAAPAKGGGAHH